MPSISTNGYKNMDDIINKKFICGKVAFLAYSALLILKGVIDKVSQHYKTYVALFWV